MNIKSNIVDLSHVICSSMPVYPGTQKPRFTEKGDLDIEGFREKDICMYSHTGTHIDAPFHIIRDGKTLDKFPLDHFWGDAFLLDVTLIGRPYIETDDLEPYLEIIKECDFLIFYTGWSKFWGTKRYFADYPVLSKEAAIKVAGMGLKGAGFDTISVDITGSKDFFIHKILFKQNMIIIENLTNLEMLDNKKPFMFSCFPLNILNADGSPVRAAAYLS